MKTLNEWFQQPLGRAVIEGIQKQWEAFELPGLLAYKECLQIGTHLSILPIRKTTILTTEFLKKTDVVASIDELPFGNDSFPIIFLPFTLECSKSISLFFDEIKRVLTPDGVLFIVGINPFSLWGLARLFHSKAMNPFHHYSHSSLNVYASLASRNFTIHGIKSFFYRPPCLSIKSLKHTRFLEPVGQMLWPYPGGLYFLLAQKVTPQLLSVEPLWRKGGYVFGKA